MSEDPNDPGTQPSPAGGWSESIETLNDAVVVPPLVNSFVQPAGVLASDGSYCARGALWRRFRPITSEPEAPKSVDQTLSGRWLWGGVLWAHFGHFLAESTSRLWALNALDKPVDGILFVPKRPRVGDETRGFQRDFIGLMERDLPIRVATEATRVEELVVPGQGFGIGPIMQGTPAFRGAIHARFATDVQPDGPEKLYISRSALGLGKGGLLGEERLEQHLSDEGYHIFHPEKHDIATQLAHYKAARKVVAADGSALHLFAMVGQADQPVAMILRRSSGANNQLAINLEHFCGAKPVIVDALRSEWLKAAKNKSNRQSFGELDVAKIGQVLQEAGFVENGTDWPPMTDAERNGILAAKGIGPDSGFIESPEYVRKRVKQIRTERRARRAAKSAAE